jgi:hypothetical protein
LNPRHADYGSAAVTTTATDFKGHISPKLDLVTPLSNRGEKRVFPFQTSKFLRFHI